MLVVVKIYRENRINLKDIKNYKMIKFYKTGHCKFEVKYFDHKKQEDKVIEVTLTHINEFVNLMNNKYISESKV